MTTPILLRCGVLAGPFYLVAAWVMSRQHVPSLARLSLVSGLAIVSGFFGGFVLPVGILGIWFAVLVGWAWLTVMSLGVNRYTATRS